MFWGSYTPKISANAHFPFLKQLITNLRSLHPFQTITRLNPISFLFSHQVQLFPPSAFINSYSISTSSNPSARPILPGDLVISPERLRALISPIILSFTIEISRRGTRPRQQEDLSHITLEPAIIYMVGTGCFLVDNKSLKSLYSKQQTPTHQAKIRHSQIGYEFSYLQPYCFLKPNPHLGKITDGFNEFYHTLAVYIIFSLN